MGKKEKQIGKKKKIDGSIQKVFSGLNDDQSIDLAIDSNHIGYQDVAETVSDRKIVGMVKFTQSWSSIIGIPFLISKKKCGV